MKSDATATIPKLKFSEKLGFGAFSTASNVVYQFKSIYYLFFLTDVLKIDVLVAGTILTIGTVWDAINDPLLGFWSVNHKFKNGERCRPFALWASVPWAATVVLLFSDFNLSDRMEVIVALLIYLVFETFNTLVGIPYNSMGSLATDRDSDRRSINIYRNLGGCVGSGIGAVACLPMLKLFGAMDAEGNLVEGGAASRGFILAAIVMGLVCIIGCLIHFFTTKERIQPIATEEKKLSVGTVTKMLFRSKSWVLNTLYIICYGVLNLLVMTCLAYYATYVIGNTSASTLIMGVYLGVAVVSSILVAPIDRALGRKKTMILAALFYIFGKIWFVIDPFSMGAIYVNAISVGFAAAVTFVMFNTNRNNIVDLIEWKDGRRLDSLVSTADNLASKLAVAGATQLIAFSLAAAGYDGKLEVQPTAAINTINALLGWVPMAVSIVMLVIILFFDIEKDMQKMYEEKLAAGQNE